MCISLQLMVGVSKSKLQSFRSAQTIKSSSTQNSQLHWPTSRSTSLLACFWAALRRACHQVDKQTNERDNRNQWPIFRHKPLSPFKLLLWRSLSENIEWEDGGWVGLLKSGLGGNTVCNNSWWTLEPALCFGFQDKCVWSSGTGVKSFQCLRFLSSDKLKCFCWPRVIIYGHIIGSPAISFTVSSCRCCENIWINLPSYET